ncbi:MAG: NAD(P)/FAD-dependent oxidoreductase, partial [Clostridia bacterium]|nr:NAD(P)/FAD-dependent oxidoreductase [Clostridia bacterium]
SSDEIKRIDIITQFDMQSEMLKVGLMTKIKSGRIYPLSEQANNVLNALICNINRYGVKLLTNQIALSIDIDKIITISTDKGDIKCKNICFATGSNATFGRDNSSIYKKLGFKVNKGLPSLSPLISKKAEQIKGLNGVRQEAKVSLYDNKKLIATEYGEVQFRKDGISGIVIMNMSARMRWNNINEGIIYLDFMPDYSEEYVSHLLENTITAEYGLLNKNLMQNAVKLGVNGIKKYRLDVVGCDDFKMAQVMHGGIDLEEVDLHNMALVKYNNVFAIGEAVDVDGICGGYNLHWAFASAYNFAKGV